VARPNHKTFRWKSAVIVDSSFCAVINAPIEKIDIPVWRFSLPDEEYQGCSPAHFAAGSTTARDGTDNRGTFVTAPIRGRSPNDGEIVTGMADAVKQLSASIARAAKMIPPQGRLRDAMSNGGGATVGGGRD
jgi:hypothetical protein